MSIVLLSGLDEQTTALLKGAADASVQWQVVNGNGAAVRTASTSPRSFDLVVLGAGLPDSVRTAQQLRTVAPGIELLLVSPPQALSGLRAAASRSPFLGASTVCVGTDDEAGMVSAFRRLLQRTATQVRYEALVHAAQERLQTVAPAPVATAMYLDRLMEFAPIGIVIVEKSLEITVWNRCAESIFGASERDVIGTSIAGIFPDPEAARFNSFLDRSRAPRSGALTETFERRATGGGQQYIDVTGTALSGEEGKGRIMLIFQDNTARVLAEIEAQKMGRQVAVAAALSRQADHLRTLNRRLQERNRELEEFAYVASHDLQEPLRKISSFSDLLFADYADALNDEAQHYLNRMREAAVRMSRLISDLLSFSRVATRGKPFAAVDLNRVLAEVVSDLEIAIGESGAKVTVDPLPTIEADATQMHQMFQNLISNAIKFRDAERPVTVHVRGRVEYTASEAGGTAACRLEVQDNSIGFDEKYLSRIFQPFQRLHTKEAYPGTGIGLAICRRIVERHGGSLTATSAAGAGSTFEIELPLKQDDGVVA